MNWTDLRRRTAAVTSEAARPPTLLLRAPKEQELNRGRRGREKERERERSADVWLVGRARGDGSECAKLKKGGRDCQESGGPA